MRYILLDHFLDLEICFTKSYDMVVDLIMTPSAFRLVPFKHHFHLAILSDLFIGRLDLQCVPECNAKIEQRSLFRYEKVK